MLLKWEQIYHAPKIGAMRGARKSIHAPEHTLLRYWLVSKRNEGGYTQRELASKLEVVHSYVAKVESGERRLDVIEFFEYCTALDAEPTDFYTKLGEATNKVK